MDTEFDDTVGTDVRAIEYVLYYSLKDWQSVRIDAVRKGDLPPCAVYLGKHSMNDMKRYGSLAYAATHRHT